MRMSSCCSVVDVCDDEDELFVVAACSLVLFECVVDFLLVVSLVLLWTSWSNCFCWRWLFTMGYCCCCCSSSLTTAKGSRKMPIIAEHDEL